MDDYDDNPIIEDDVRSVLSRLGIETSFYVDRHVLGDGKHKIIFDELGKEVDVDGWTKRSVLKEMVKVELK